MARAFWEPPWLPNSNLGWSYSCDRRHQHISFTQTNIFYVADLQENENVKCFQYANDSTIYDHAKISDLNNCRNTISQSINKLSAWSKQSTLAFNNDKTKVMILSTPQMSRVHHLDEYDPNIVVSGYKQERIKSCNCLEFTSMSILSGTITSSTRYLDATPLYRY